MFVKINDNCIFLVNTDFSFKQEFEIDKKLKEVPVTPYVEVEIFTH